MRCGERSCYRQGNKKHFYGTPLISAIEILAVSVEFCMQGKDQFSIAMKEDFLVLNWWGYQTGDMHMACMER
jgi:hypothetical protein